MNRFNKSDKVRIKEDLIGGQYYGAIYFSEEMEKYCGLETEISRVANYYKLNIDDGEWYWSDEMLESVEKEIGGRYFEVVSEDKRKTMGEIQLPTRGSEYSIAYDLYSPIDITIEPMTSGMIWTDVKAKFNKDEALLINVRSSMGEQPIMLANTQGWVESDYYGNKKNDGNLGVNLFNLGKEPYVIKKGDRIAQAMFINYLESSNGNTDKKREGGFGSTNERGDNNE